jgi:hypothetical protein
MSAWWTYRLADFVLFAPATWLRLFQRYHEALWPAQALAGAVGAWLLMAALQRRWRAATLLALAVGWAWVGVVFHGHWHASLNWAAPALALGFVLQALLLAGAAAAPGVWVEPGRRRSAGLVLLALALGAGPALALAGGRVEVLGLTPDATALGTLGLLLCTRPASPWLGRALWPLPLAATLLGGLTAWALRA